MLLPHSSSSQLRFLYIYFLFVLLVQASAEGGSESDQRLSLIVRVGHKAVGSEAEQPSGSVDQPRLTTQGEEDGCFEAEAPGNRRVGKHKGTDPSVAGGGVILGGLAMAVFAAVFSYIRVTITSSPSKAATQMH